MDTLKRHLNSQTEETYKCPMCTYHSPRMESINRHLLGYKKGGPPRPTMATRLETKPYHVNPTSVNSYLYQEAFPWILQELDAPPPRISRLYYINEPIIIPLKATKQLPDPRIQEALNENTSINSEKDEILNQKLEASTSLSELNYMLRQLEADETAPTHTEREETTAWTVLDEI